MLTLTIDKHESRKGERMSAEKIIWSVPQIEYRSLASVQEGRPLALIVDPQSWARVSNLLSLPVVVQAEPDRLDQDFLAYLSDNVPSLVEVVYVVGSGIPMSVGKIIAHNNNLPVVVIPTELDSDQLLEAHVELMTNGIITTVHTGAPEKIIVDWEVIRSAEPYRRAGMVADMLAIVTGLLDWRHAAKLKRTAADQPFVPWAAGIAAGLASHTIKIADAIGRGEVEALQNLLDVTSVSVQLANQLGHARQQEGTEHYFAFALEKNGVRASHAECLGPGILLTSALHSQDPSALRDALLKSGIRLDQLRPADIQLAITELPSFVMANDLPYGIAHELDPYSDMVQQALQMAGIMAGTGGWTMGSTGGMAPVQGSTGAVASAPATPFAFQADTGAMPAQQPSDPSQPPQTGSPLPPAQS
jgi:glycerol-1-phosphate dehydrogenase [NAD(P)+]